MDAGLFAWAAGALALSYLLGALPCAWLAGRLVLGLDLRRVGSGNPGATNLGRTAGGRKGLALFLAVFALDAAKGYLAAAVVPEVYLGARLAPAALAALAAGCAAAAVAGHLFSVFLAFRGGKGVACGFGAALGLTPLAALAAVLIWLAVLGLTGIVSVASLLAAVSYPLACLATLAEPPGAAWPRLAFALAVAAAVVAAHRANLRRLREGREPRLWGKRAAGGAAPGAVAEGSR